MKALGPPLVNEAISFLDAYRPQVLAEIRQTQPDLVSAGILTPGQKLGNDSPALLRQLADVVERTLREQIDECDRRLPQSRRRLRTIRKLQSLGEVLAAVGSASVLGFLAGKYFNASVVGGLIALAGSLMAIATNHMGKTHDPDSSLGQLYAELTRLRAEARIRRTELAARTAHFDSSGEWNDSVCDYLIREGNDLCRRSRILLDRLPV